MRTLMQIIANNPEQLISLLGINAQPPGMADTFRSLADDIGQLQKDGSPTEEALDNAPVIENWAPAISPLGIVLIGEVVGHPLLRGPIVRTSPVCIIDDDLKWARTLNRFYRLGAPASVNTQASH